MIYLILIAITFVIMLALSDVAIIFNCRTMHLAERLTHVVTFIIEMLIVMYLIHIA